MALVRARSFRSSSPARRTNWLSAGPAFTAEFTDGTSDEIILFDQGNTASELSKYVNPTLTRLRGQILFDITLGSAAGAVAAHGYFAIWVGPDGETFSWDKDNILWTGAAGSQSNVREDLSGSGRFAFGMVQNVPVIEVDSKAQRKLEDASQVKLHVEFPTIANPDTFVISYMIRGLFKE